MFTWCEELIFLLNDLGGGALRQIYKKFANYANQSPHRKMIKSYDAAIRNQLEAFSLESKKFCGKEVFIMCEKGSGHYKLVKQYIIENFDKMSDHERITKIMSF